MKSYRKELWMKTATRRALVNLTPEVEACLAESGIREGLCLVNAMHITAGVFINDDEPSQFYWKHDTGSRIWASTLVADGKVYLGTEKGDLWVLAAGKECKVLSRIRMGCPVCATPIVANGVLYVTS